MAKIDLTPLLEKIDGAVVELVTPPFRIWEPFDVVKICGEILKEAAPLATKDEYEEALDATWNYLDGKHHIVEKLDEAIKSGIAEAIDGWLIRKAIETVAIPQMATFLATEIG